MRFVRFNLLSSTAATASATTAPFDLNQIIRMSAQVVVGAGTATGTVQLQVSNDPAPVGNIFPDNTFTNWSNLGSPASISASGATLVAEQEMCYRALRAVFTNTFANVVTITAVADVAGSLNSKYFLASSTTADYYFWFDDGAGVDPAIAGRTGIHVSYTDGDTASTIGGLIRAAAAGKGWTVTGATTQAILTNSPGGPSTPASDGAAPTGFTITNTQPTASISINLMCIGV